MIKHGESDEIAVNKIYSHVYAVREADHGTINILCEKNGKDYRGQAFSTIFNRNRELLKRQILLKEAAKIKKENNKEEAKTFSWSASIQRRR